MLLDSQRKPVRIHLHRVIDSFSYERVYRESCQSSRTHRLYVKVFFSSDFFVPLGDFYCRLLFLSYNVLSYLYLPVLYACDNKMHRHLLGKPKA